MGLPSFPVDDVILDAVEHALGGVYTYDDGDGHALPQGLGPRLIKADYSLSQLMDFLAGYDEKKSIQTGYIGQTPLYEYTGGQLYCERDIIAALIVEVRRLRAKYEATAPD
jgi:hypothetical protein